MTTMPIRVILTDLDGVIRDWSGQRDDDIERDTGLPEGAIKEAAFDPEQLIRVITGRISDEAWRRQTVDRLRERYPDADAARAVAAWSEPAGEVDREVLELLQRCRERVPLVLVTNATSRLDRDLSVLGIAAAFDHIVNSSVVGAAKPDRAIFEHALDRVGADPAEALYVDDTERYHGPAAELGIVTHHFRGVDGLRAELDRHGLLP